MMDTNTKNLTTMNTQKPIRRAAVVPRYSPMLYILLILLLVDFFINSFNELLKSTRATALVFYIVQDLSIFFSALLILIMLINTYMFQAGLIGYMIGKFKSLWFLTLIYLGLCFALQIWLMTIRWDNTYVNVWSTKTNYGLTVIYVFQRTFSVLYYYIYKRTAYRLSDPRFYEDSDWLRNQFERRQ